MVVGNTELGIEMTIGKRSYPTMIQSNKVSELTKITVNEEGVCAGKFFTYVIKTCANLTTYSRRLENYNGTIIFEIDIMKIFSPINLKFTFLSLSKSKWHFFSGAVS